MYRPNSSFFFTWKGRQLWLSYSQNGAKVFTNSHLHSDGNLMAASDQLNTFFLSLWLVCCVTSQKVRKKVFNWSEVHFYQSNILQNPYFNTYFKGLLSLFIHFLKSANFRLISEVTIYLFMNSNLVWFVKWSWTNATFQISRVFWCNVKNLWRFFNIVFIFIFRRSFYQFRGYFGFEML